MSTGIPAPPPKKQQIRDLEEGESENEEEPVLLQEDDDEESGDDASTNASGDDSEPSVVDSDESGDEVAEADISADEGDEAASEDEAVIDASSSKKKKKRNMTTAKKNIEDDMTLLGVPHGIHFDDDEEEEDDEVDEDADKDSSEYFQKLKSSVRESYVEMYHPESLSHNYDEIQTLSRVIRNSAGVIVDGLHRTIPIMTKYEKTRILGQRTKQINEGAPTFIKIDSTVIDGYLIAVKELEQKKTPFIIRRPLPNGGSEYWRIQDLEIL